MKKLLLLICLSLLMARLPGQKLPLDNFTVQNGLPQNSISSIIQDRQGYLWFGSQVGVARYDGYEFVSYTTADGLPDNYINCLLLGKDGRIWIGTEGGVAVYDGTSFISFTQENGLVDNRVDHLLSDLSGNIWVQTAYGISVILPDTIISYTKENALYSNEVIDMYCDRQGNVYVATFPGLTVFSTPRGFEKKYGELIIRDILQTTDGTLWYATQESSILRVKGREEEWIGSSYGLKDNIVLSLMEDRNGTLWCGTYSRGIYAWEGDRFINKNPEMETPPVPMKLMEDRQGRIWIMTPGEGVWIYQDGEFQHITHKSNLLQDLVFDMFEDANGNIWLGTYSGLTKYGRVIFELFDTEMGLPDNAINSVFIDSRDRLWAGAMGFVIFKNPGGDIGYSKLSWENESPIPLCFAEDQDHRIWIGTDFGLYCFDGRSYRHFGHREGLKSTIIYSLQFLPDNSLWCGTDSGLVCYDGKRFEHYGSESGLVNEQINALEWVDNRLWCATEGGISVFTASGKLVRNLTGKDGLRSSTCIDLAHDEDGNVWVATLDGLAMISPGSGYRVMSYSIEDGLISNTIYFVEFENKEELWIGNEKGINTLGIHSKKIDYYGFVEGFTPIETNSRAVSRMSNGDLWIGTNNGIIQYRVRNNIRDAQPPGLILYPPMINGKSSDLDLYSDGIDESGLPIDLVLPYNRNSLSFRFTGIHYTNPSKNRFWYKLEGYDDDWSKPSGDREVEYKKLPNGTYTFKLLSSNLDGATNPQPLTFTFQVKPPFWKTFWFIAIYVIIGIVLVVWIIKIRERQLIKEKRILEEKVRERTREIEDQKVEIEAQRDEIQEQKNYVEKQRDQIAFQNKEITDSILYAKRIQQAALPGIKTLKKTLNDHFILFRPRDIVSGDFYWVERIDGLIVACAADCTGHGVPGAFMSMLGLTFLNEIVNKDRVKDSDEILNRLRKSIITALSHRDEDSQANDGMDLALVVIDPAKDELQFSGANNPLILVRGGELIEYKG
ncbi:MAG: ligand-binding sensor domain-containing protein, partial [Bacteroidota bacterium]